MTGPIVFYASSFSWFSHSCFGDLPEILVRRYDTLNDSFGIKNNFTKYLK